jgi:hypothetical protein
MNLFTSDEPDDRRLREELWLPSIIRPLKEEKPGGGEGYKTYFNGFHQHDKRQNRPDRGVAAAEVAGAKPRRKIGKYQSGKLHST